MICLLVLTVITANAQFIRFTLTLPPSFELKDQPDPPQIIEPISENRLANEMAGLRWVEIRTTENVNLIVEMHFKSQNFSSSMNVFFLNDGSSNFSNAQKLARGENTVLMHNGNRTITETPGKLKYISAWLGLPSRNEGTLTIVYP